jgi:lipoate synthase
MTPPVAQLHEGLVQIDLTPKKPAPKPAWLKAKAPMGETFHNLKKMARELNLHTVCESAHCPNIGECWNQKAATFMMLGIFARGGVVFARCRRGSRNRLISMSRGGWLMRWRSLGWRML